MKPVVAFSIVLVACSADKAPGGPEGSDSQHASLHLVFGSSAVELETIVISSATSSRLLLQSSDADTTVFVSLAIPLQPERIALSTSAETASVWATHSSMQPLIATSGSLAVQTVDGSLSFVFEDVSKPADAVGESLTITGAMTGVSVPQ